MTGLRPWREIKAAIQELEEIQALGVTVAGRWLANLATPAIVCVPVRRVELRGSSVRWELALQVIVGVQDDEDETVHALLELVLPALPAGVIRGDTVYGQDDRAGGSYVVSTTTLSV